MKFDMNLAWREASGMVSVNAQVLAIIAGVFFFLPSLAMALFAPMPQTTGSMDEAQAMNMVTTYYSEAAPWLIVVGIAQAVGVLSLLALLTDRRRPTVGEALKAGAIGFLPYFAAQILLGLAIVIVFAVIVGAATASGSVALAAIFIPLGVAGFIYIMTKTSLTAPVIVIDGVRNPIRALARSWRLTRRNSLRLFGFYFLVFLAFMVILIVISMIVGAATMMALGAGMVSQIANGIVSGVAGALMVVYFVAIIASAHRQLSGPSPEVVSRTFE